MNFTQPEQRVRTGARRVRVDRAVPTKAAAIIAALGIALVVTMGPSPASAQVTVVRDCGDHYVVVRYNSDGSVNGVHKKQLSDEGTIYTVGKTWKLVEGNPDRFVSEGGAQLLVVACDATPGKGARGLGGVQQDGAQAAQSSSTLVSNTTNSGGNTFFLEAQQAQAFTTGSNAPGYRLTGVDLIIRRQAGVPVSDYSVSIHRDSSGLPGSKLGTLTRPGSLPTGFQTLRFAASGDGIDVAPDRTYWLVTTSNANVYLNGTNQTAESVAAAGWSIADERFYKDPGWDPTNKIQILIRMALVGFELTRHVQLPESQYSHLSRNRSTLYDHYVSQCTHIRSVSDPYRDYSLFDADGRRIQASNGWKYVYAQDSQGNVTGTRPMLVSECASHGLYQRQSFCSSEDLKARNGHIWDDICPDVRTW